MTTDTADLSWNLHDRLHKSLRVSGHTALSLATVLGLHRNTINSYLSGKTAIDRRTLIAWAFATGVPLAWLETGDGPDLTTRIHVETGPDEAHKAALEQLAGRKRARHAVDAATHRYAA